MTDEPVVDRVLGSMIRSAEMHEMNEWFKLDGKCVTEPYP